MGGRLCVVRVNNLFCHCRNFGVGLVCKVEISFLVAPEGKIESARLRLVPGIGAGDGESAIQRRLVSGVSGADRIIDDAIPAASTLHHEVAVPGILRGQSQREPNPELLAAYSLAGIDHTFHTAMSRQGVSIMRVICGNRGAGWNRNGAGNLDAVNLEIGKFCAGSIRLSACSERGYQECQNDERKIAILHPIPSFLEERFCAAKNDSKLAEPKMS